MIRAAALVAGDGAMLQVILDSIYFKEFPDFKLEAVICPRKEDYAMVRAIRAEIPSFVVDPDLFPTSISHSMAVANKLKDMDIELVILAGYDVSLGVIPYQFKNRIISIVPCLVPAFEDLDSDSDVVAAAIDRGVKITGATAYFVSDDGGIGGIISQQAIPVLQNDTPETLRARITEECEWKLMSKAISLFCEGRLSFRGNKVYIKETND